MRPPHPFAAVSAVLLAACASAPESAAPRAAATEPPPLRAGARDAVLGFVESIDRLDGPGAAAYIDWASWVGEDAQLAALVHSLRAEFSERPLTVEEAASKPIKGSTVSLGEILDQRSSGLALARAARERFETGLAGDFPETRGSGSTRLVAWHEDSRESSATVRMPDGTIVEFVVIGMDGRYRLIPRW